MTTLRFQFRLVSCVVFGLSVGVGSRAVGQETIARGVVYHDQSRDGVRGDDEPGIAGVGVSNGADIVLTDAHGRYELPVSDDCVIFVIKPRNWMTAVDELNLPKFWINRKPAGSPRGLRYRGVAPTGPLPESVDFPLYARPEPGEFRVVMAGDPQSRDITEVGYLADDVLAELIGIEAAFGIALGDIVFDDMSLYPAHNAVMSRVGIPWYNVHGNHDMNFDVTSDELADETWERVYGPPTFAFNFGPVHFIVIDNVHYEGDVESKKYHSLFGRHLAFIENNLRHVEPERLIVLLMHIPITETRDRAALFDLLASRPHTVSFAAHRHIQRHEFLGSEHGWKRDRPHHHVVHGTMCGSWWQGAPDERGIPHATQADGVPNGYSIVTFSGNEYSIRFKAARRPADEQMVIHLPPLISSALSGSTEVLVNVYAGSERSMVEMRVTSDGEWTRMEQVERTDPAFEAIKAMEDGPSPPPGRKLPRAAKTTHMWVGRLPANLPRGVYTVEVRTTDMFAQTDHAKKILRVD